MTLERYRTKRDFSRTPEPSGDGGWSAAAPGGGGRFVVQRHRARQLHYDFRLEMEGVLASWAVPKGPSLDPSVRRAAFHVEDHPLDYYDFEGTIPKGEYGAGDVIVWDWGTYAPEAATANPGQAIRDGELKLVLHGEKLNGRFTLVKTKGTPGGGREDDSWLLIKKRDERAVPGWDVETHPLSVKTGRTNDEVAAGVPAREVHAGPTDKPPAPSEIPGTPAPMPDFVEPMKATLVDRPFSDPRWLFELKWDGWRLQAHVRDGKLALFSKRGLDALGQFAELRDLATCVAANQAILDGEVVALDAAGKPSFSLLQGRNRLGGRSRGGPGEPGREAPAIVYQAFDLLYLEGHSLLDVPLEDRKALLRSILRESPAVRYAGHVLADGDEFYRAVSERELEGMVAKLRTSHYEAGRRSPAWLKIKRRAEQELVVGGWTSRDGDTPDLAALLLGVYEDGELRPVGKAGTGWDAGMRRSLVAALEPLARPTSAFKPIPKERDARWVEPKLVVRVEFAEWTADGNLRAASFKGVDPDVDPKSVSRERQRATDKLVTEASATVVSAPVAPAAAPAPELAAGPSQPIADPSTNVGVTADELRALDELPGKGGLWNVDGRTLKLSNLDKVLWPDDGITKRDLIRYYVSMAPFLLPYLEKRSLTLRRYPDGVAKTGFWQKQTPKHAPEWIDCWTWDSRSTGERTDYIVVDSVAALGWISNEAAIDVHPSTFRIAAPETPTWALIDIDPGLKTTWDDLVLFARLYRTALDHVGVRGFPKVTGQRGIQVWIPVAAKYTFDQTRDWVEALSRTIAAATPGMVSWEWEKNRRQGLARLDFTQNAWNKTLVAPYSLRPGPGAPVSAPISWDELDDPELRPNRWTIESIGRRVAERGDLFRPALDLAQELPTL